MRLAHLDAVRGLAAVTVAVFHFLRAYAPGSLAPSYLNGSPFGALWNGHFAVEVFFVLSGYLFLHKFLGVTPLQGVLAAVKRYLRLSLPTLGVCVAAWALLVAGAFNNRDAAAISGSDWLARWYSFSPSLADAVWEALAGMYVSFKPLSSYNSNLWTIRYELFAVWGVIAAGSLLGGVNRRWQLLALAVAAVLAWDTYALAFVLGAAIVLVRRAWTWQAPLAIALIAMLGALWLGAIGGPGIHAPRILWPLAATMLVLTVDVVPTIRTALEAPWLQRLGSMSFGVYLMHFITINSVAASAYLSTHSIFVTAAVYVATTALAAWAFRDLLDVPSQKLLSRVFSRRSASVLSGTAC